MGRRVSKTTTPAQIVENRLQFGAPSNYYSRINRPKVEKKTKVIEVAVVKWILVVPFNFERHTVLVAIYLVGWRLELCLVHDNLRVEAFFRPSQLKEMTVQPICDRTLAPAWLQNIAAKQLETTQHRENVVPLLRVSRRQNGKPVPPLVHLEVLGDFSRDDGLIRHRRIVRTVLFAY